MSVKCFVPNHGDIEGVAIIRRELELSEAKLDGDVFAVISTALYGDARKNNIALDLVNIRAFAESYCYEVSELLRRQLVSEGDQVWPAARRRRRGMVIAGYDGNSSETEPLPQADQKLVLAMSFLFCLMRDANYQSIARKLIYYAEQYGGWGEDRIPYIE